jgi:hypothetical protein
LVDDIGEKTNGAWKKENINSQDIDLAVAARHHHPDFLITGDKLKIKEISSKHKYTMTIQNIETKECYVL